MANDAPNRRVLYLSCKQASHIEYRETQCKVGKPLCLEHLRNSNSRTLLLMWEQIAIALGGAWNIAVMSVYGEQTSSRLL